MLLDTTDARLLKLSESFSFEGMLVVNAANVTMVFPQYNLAHDAVRRLQHLDLIENTPEGEVRINSINSGYENRTYVASEGKCEEKPLDTSLFTFDINTWKIFEVAKESPDGVYTIETTFERLEIVTHNGLPTSYTTTTMPIGSDTISTSLTFITYRNETPPFHVFSLPEGCSQSCGYCPNSAAGVASSFFLLLTTIIIFLFALV